MTVFNSIQSQPTTTTNTTTSDEFSLFANALKLQKSNHNPLDPNQGAVVLWKSICENKLKDSSNSTQDLESWKLERNTWQLVQMLYTERLNSKYLHTNSENHNKNPYTTPLELVNQQLPLHPDLLELSTVRDWLYTCPTPTHPTEIRRGYWPYTKSAYKHSLQKQFTNTATPLDPDAPLRNHPLDHLDQEYDRAMIRTLFEYIRSGEIELALDFCRQCDHPWRAASISGGRLFHEPGLSEAQHEEDEEVPQRRTGCLNRKLWKSVCLQISNNPSLSPYEQALYGALSGQVGSVLPVCYSWEDHLWCYINSIFENHVDAILESSESGSFWNRGEGGLTGNGGGGDRTVKIKEEMRKAFDKVLRSENASVAESARNPFHVAQMWLAIDQINDLITTFHQQLESTPDITTAHLSHLLRFFAHLILFLRLMDQTLDPEASNAILRAYVQVLEMENKHDLIAFYVAQLLPQSGVETYAKYLISLGPSADQQTRKIALLRASEHGLDLSRVACTAVQITLQEIAQTSTNSNRDHGLSRFTHELKPKEIELIRSLEWLTVDPITYFDALLQGNSLIRYFLANGHPNAARQVVTSIPPDLLTYVANNEDSSAEDWMKSQASMEILEFTHYQDFFVCLELHLEVNEILSHRPVLQGSVVGSDVSEYAKVLDSQCHQLHEVIVKLLQSEWLQDLEPSSSSSSSSIGNETKNQKRRTKELNQIRKIYIPELVFRLHDALVQSSPFIVQNLRKALDLATIIADESYKTYIEFLPSTEDQAKGEKTKMEKYLDLIRLVTLDLLKVSGSGGGEKQHWLKI